MERLTKRQGCGISHICWEQRKTSCLFHAQQLTEVFSSNFINKKIKKIKNKKIKNKKKRKRKKRKLSSHFESDMQLGYHLNSSQS